MGSVKQFVGETASSGPLDGTLARSAGVSPGVTNSINMCYAVQFSPFGPTATPWLETPKVISEATRMLAAVAYGEGSTGDVFEELAAIANVLVRQQKARGHASITRFMNQDRTFAFAAHDGNQRYAKLMETSVEKIWANAGMQAAVRGAQNALASSPIDHSNGAYFWDGADIKTNYKAHSKVRDGIKFSKSAHNIYSIDEKEVPGEAWWYDKKGKKIKSRGKWLYKFLSTAAFGGTIFWKYADDFIKASGNKPHD